jgi:uncharacterized membrane protein YgcG
MKCIASLLLFVFSCTVTLPLAQSLFAAKKVTVFVVDEEKSTSNQLTEIKEQKKDLSNQLYLADITVVVTPSLTKCGYEQAVIPPAPLLEKTTPPPNFC